MEEWRPIANEPGYEISNLGNARSLDRIKIVFWRDRYIHRHYKGSPLTLMLKKPGYYCIALPKRGTSRIHVLVCEAFNGPPPNEDAEVAHNDGTKLNNTWTNLRWDSHAANEHDKRIHGTHNRGERHALHKLTEVEVLAIRRLATAGIAPKIIAAKYGIVDRTVSDIKLRKRWRWLE